MLRFTKSSTQLYRMYPAIDIRSLRRNRGLTLRKAASAMGVEFNALSRAERGTARPNPANAVRIASFYDLRVTDVWPDPVTEEAAA